jgi:hypothetical protein
MIDVPQRLAFAECTMVEDGSESQAWIDDEFAASRLSDVRLGRRLRQLVTQMAGAVGGPISLACQD